MRTTATGLAGSSSKSGKRSQGSQSEGAQIIGCELYQKLQYFLESYLEKLQKVNFVCFKSIFDFEFYLFMFFFYI